ncbi:MAG: transcription termination/antitermination factor NusG [Candidatus Amoebophilus sp. 36-38]|nr:MAG: transcription termination/antitermination factor NusG [Candidatus Amoebophilus sp. 36-38]
MKSDQKWYVLKVVSGQEKVVKSHLEVALEEASLRSYVSQILIPSEKIYEMRAGKKQMRERNFFPGYIILYADLSDGRVRHLIKEVPNAMGFLGARGWGSSSQPIPLREKEINKILGRVDEVADSESGLDKPFVIGETVKIVDGPFNGFTGSIQEIFEERKKLNVIVKIFERDTPIELTYSQVEKIL